MITMADQPSLTKCNKKKPTDYIKSLHAYAYQHSSIILLIYKSFMSCKTWIIHVPVYEFPSGWILEFSPVDSVVKCALIILMYEICHLDQLLR